MASLFEQYERFTSSSGANVGLTEDVQSAKNEVYIYNFIGTLFYLSYSFRELSTCDQMWMNQYLAKIKSILSLFLKLITFH